MSHDILERRYRALLRSYPADYRRDRTDELLEILVGDAPPTRRWPEPRQAVALVRAGLRVRGGSAAARPSAVLLWQGLQLAAMALLAVGTLIAVDDALELLAYGGLSEPLRVLADLGPNLILMVAALATLVLGRQRAATGLVLAAIVAQTAVSDYLFANGMPQWWAPVVAAPLVIAGLRRPADVPPVDRGNAVLVTAGVLALHLVPIAPSAAVAAAAAGVLVVFLWVATADRRLLLAAAPTFVLGTLHQATVSPGSVLSFDRVDALPSLLVGVTMLAAVAVAARRRSTLA